MLANTRIQWFHKTVSDGAYPNANRMAERFAISHRQAQRDIDFLRTTMKAPLAYDSNRKGFYYTEPYSLPILLISSNDTVFLDDKGRLSDTEGYNEGASVVQMQLPFNATIQLEDKLAAVEMASYIVDKEGAHQYKCEFHSVKRFLASLVVAAPTARILEPDWLRTQMLELVKNVAAANADAK